MSKRWKSVLCVARSFKICLQCAVRVRSTEDRAWCHFNVSGMYSICGEDTFHRITACVGCGHNFSVLASNLSEQQQTRDKKHQTPDPLLRAAERLLPGRSESHS